jgi:hypothetical protein
VWTKGTISGFPVKLEEQSPSGVASITIPASGTLPSTFRYIKIHFMVRSTFASSNDVMSLQFNGDTAAHYDYQSLTGLASSVSTASSFNQTSAQAATLSAASAGAGLFNKGVIEIVSYADIISRKIFYAQTSRNDVSFGLETRIGDWQTTNAAVTTITLLIQNGNFAVGSFVETWLFP